MRWAPGFGFALLAVACGTSSPPEPPEDAALADTGDESCLGDEADRDGDGARSLACGGDDCDDDAPLRNPAAIERCNGLDDNCNGTVDEGIVLDTLQNCGRCGTDCPTTPRSNAAAACVEDVGGVRSCGYVCDDGHADCNSDDADGCEVDLASDASHCGACGTVCAIGYACAAGVCGDTPVQVSTGGGNYGTSCVLLAAGEVWCWGDGTHGRIGEGGTADPHHAVLDGTPLTGVVQVEAGELHTCVLFADGTFDCFGNDWVAQIPDGTPVAAVVELAVGGWHSCVRTSDGEVWCWGANHCEQSQGVLAADSATPIALPGVTGAVDLGLGRAFTCIAGSDGGVDCWGTAGTNCAPAPAGIDIDDAESIDAGNGIACAVGADGVPRCWGSRMPASTGLPAAQLSVGFDHACQVDLDGAVWCWGANDDRAAGGTMGDTSVHRVVGLPGPAVQIASGAVHSCAILADGSVWCWGQNSEGELGADAGTVSGPVRVEGLPEGG